MKKYFYIFKSNLMTSLKYVFDFVFGFISVFCLIFIFVNLWQYMYGDGESLISGYSLNQMIWYVIFTEIIWMSVRGRAICQQTTKDIKSGNIAYNIIKPYNYVLYILSNHFGKIIVKLLIYSVAGIATGLLLIGKIPNFNILCVPFVAISTILAIIITTLIAILIALSSFWIENSNPFWWLYSKFILIFGTLFPIEFFNGILHVILKYSPVYVTSYGPSKLLIDFSFDKFLYIFVAQIIYIICLLSIDNLIYKKGVKKLNVNGG